MILTEVSSRKDKKSFHKLPFIIYKNIPQWIPHIKQEVENVFNKEKNKFFQHGKATRFIIKNTKQELIGRIAVFINYKKSNTEKQPTGGIGFFECINNQKAAKAVCFKEAMQPSFRESANNVVINARALADALTKHGLRIVSGGTDNHLILVDLRPLGLKGNEAEKILEDVSIVVNKNAIPNDPERPRVTSGLRLGSAALTSRGFGIREMDKIADMIVRAMKSSGDAAALESVKNEAESLASSFPVPGIDL